MTVAERHEWEREHIASVSLVHFGAEEDYAQYNTGFHSRLYEGAHSRHIHELVTLTRRRLAPFRRAQFRLMGRLSQSWQEHDAIVTAIMRADGPAAAEAARAHVAKVSNVRAVFAQAASA